ncbi:MAG: DUF1559 domain-containing protein, partial [Victivallaceae bacterium]|nr:DUF1559 domain-containing protein [Victivallaceae bacterium]
MISFTGAFRIILFFLGAFSVFLFAVLFEAALFKIFFKRNWKKILKSCAGINSAMAFFLILLGISIILPASIISHLFPVFSSVVIILGWLTPPIIIIRIKRGLYKNYWKDVSSEKLLAVLAVSNIIIYIIFSLWIFSQIFIPLGSAREKMRRVSCKSNLKSIGLCLLQYAMDYNDYLPDKPSAAGLEQLRSNDYLTDYGVYLCPSTTTTKGKGNQKLSKKIIDYVYKNGYKSTNPDKAKIPVVWDKADNHKDYGNV